MKYNFWIDAKKRTPEVDGIFNTRFNINGGPMIQMSANAALINYLASFYLTNTIEWWDESLSKDPFLAHIDARIKTRSESLSENALNHNPFDNVVDELRIAGNAYVDFLKNKIDLSFDMKTGRSLLEYLDSIMANVRLCVEDDRREDSRARYLTALECLDSVRKGFLKIIKEQNDTRG